MRGRRHVGVGLLRRNAREGGGLVDSDLISGDDLTAVDGGLSLTTVDGGEEITLIAEVPDLLERFTTRLRAWYEVTEATLTQAGGVASALADLSSYGFHVEQPTLELRPAVVAGPNSMLALDMGDNTAICMSNTAISLSAGRRLSWYAVMQCDDSASERVTWSTRDDEVGTSGNATSCGRGASTFTLRLSSATGNQVVSSAGDTSWHVFSIRSIATGNEARKDNLIITPIDFSGSEACRAIESLWIGRTGSSSGGKLSSLALIEDVTDYEDQLVRSRFRSIYNVG